MTISNERMERALNFLVETDREYADARALMEGLKDQSKIIRGQALLRTAGTVAEREALAYTSPEYVAHIAKLKDATQDYHYLAAKRSTESAVIDCWRSLNSARTKGLIS